MPTQKCTANVSITTWLLRSVQMSNIYHTSSHPSAVKTACKGSGAHSVILTTFMNVGFLFHCDFLFNIKIIVSKVFQHAPLHHHCKNSSLCLKIFVPVELSVVGSSG